MVAELQDGRRLLAKAEKGVLHGPVVLFGVFQILQVTFFKLLFHLMENNRGPWLKFVKKGDKSPTTLHNNPCGYIINPFELISQLCGLLITIGRGTCM
jgi:hypothetical protein